MRKWLARLWPGSSKLRHKETPPAGNRAGGHDTTRRKGRTMNTMFEHCGLIIAVKRGDRTIIRCRAAVTDLGDEESLAKFVARHGGDEGVAEYLADCLRKAVQS